jgi:hypothetical protein
MSRKFIFNNFIPSSITNSYCCRKYDQIWGESPSDSNLTANITRDSNRMYRTIIKITASCGKFTGEATNTSVMGSVDIATEMIHRVLTDWKVSVSSPELLALTASAV